MLTEWHPGFYSGQSDGTQLLVDTSEGLGSWLIMSVPQGTG